MVQHAPALAALVVQNREQLQAYLPAVVCLASADDAAAYLERACVRAVLAHAIKVLQLNRIELQCAAGNRASMALAGRLGFAHEGVLRQAECLNGVFVDLHVYGLLRADFVPEGAPSSAFNDMPGMPGSGSGQASGSRHQSRR